MQQTVSPRRGRTQAGVNKLVKYYVVCVTYILSFSAGFFGILLSNFTGTVCWGQCCPWSSSLQNETTCNCHHWQRKIPTQWLPQVSKVAVNTQKWVSTAINICGIFSSGIPLDFWAFVEPPHRRCVLEEGRGEGEREGGKKRKNVQPARLFSVFLSLE